MSPQPDKWDSKYKFSGWTHLLKWTISLWSSQAGTVQTMFSLISPTECLPFPWSMIEFSCKCWDLVLSTPSRQTDWVAIIKTLSTWLAPQYPGPMWWCWLFWFSAELRNHFYPSCAKWVAPTEQGERTLGSAATNNY